MSRHNSRPTSRGVSPDRIDRPARQETHDVSSIELNSIKSQIEEHSRQLTKELGNALLTEMRREIGKIRDEFRYSFLC